MTISFQDGFWHCTTCNLKFSSRGIADVHVGTVHKTLSNEKGVTILSKVSNDDVCALKEIGIYVVEDNSSLQNITDGVYFNSNFNMILCTICKIALHQSNFVRHFKENTNHKEKSAKIIDILQSLVICNSYPITSKAIEGTYLLMNLK